MLDYIYVSQSQAKKPAVNDSFFGAVLRECRSFIYSFIADYSNIGGESAYEKSINVWVNSGRDQANVLNAMINDMFIPETNIGVSLKITSASVIQAYLSGNAPRCIDYARPRSARKSCPARSALRFNGIF